MHKQVTQNKTRSSAIVFGQAIRKWSGWTFPLCLIIKISALYRLMGANAHNVDIRSIPGHNPPLSQFQLVSSGPNYYLWENRLLSRSVIEYTFNMSSSSLLHDHIQSYIWRHNNPLLVSTAYFKEEEGKQKYSIFYERVFTNLGRIKDLCFEDSLELYYVGLKGFQLLFQHFGGFEVEEDMFHITQESKIKVWCDHNIARIYPSTSQTTEQGMVSQIITIIEQNTDHGGAPIRVGNVLRQSSRTFNKAIERFVRLCKQCNFHLTNQLKCLYTIYKGGVENYVDDFAQSPASKIKSFKQLEDKLHTNSSTKLQTKIKQKSINLEQTKKQTSYSSPKPIQFIPNSVQPPISGRVVNASLQLPRSLEPRQVGISPHRQVPVVYSQPLRKVNQNITNHSNPNNTNNSKRFYKVNFSYKNHNNQLSPVQSNLTKRNIRNYNVRFEKQGMNISPIKQFIETVKREEIPAQLEDSKLITKYDQSQIAEEQKQVARQTRKEGQVTYKSMLQKLKAKYNSISYNSDKVPEFSYDYQSNSTNHTKKFAHTKNDLEPTNTFSLEQNQKVTIQTTQSKITGQEKIKPEYNKSKEQTNGKKYVPTIDDDIWRDMLNLKTKTTKV